MGMAEGFTQKTAEGRNFLIETAGDFQKYLNFMSGMPLSKKIF